MNRRDFLALSAGAAAATALAPVAFAAAEPMVFGPWSGVTVTDFDIAPSRPVCNVCGAPATHFLRELIDTTPVGAVYATCVPGKLRTGCDEHPV